MTKIAELVAELSFKVSGLDDLTKMDNQVKSIASNARDAVIALRQLARVQLPKQFIPQGGGRAPQGALPRGAALAGIVPTGSSAGGNAASMIRSANILVQSARIVVQEGSFGGGGRGGGGGGVIPNAGGDGPGLGGIAKLGLGLLGFATLLGAVRGLVSGLKEMVQGSRAAAFATDKLSASTGLNLRELKKWEAVATRVDLAPGTVEGALSELTKKKADLENGISMNTTPYSYLGIDWRADAGTQLRQFFQSTQTRTRASAESAAGMLGLDPRIVAMRDQLDRNGNPPELPEGTELTKAQQAATMQLNSAWQDMIFNTQTLARKLTADLSPALESVINKINTFDRFLIKDNGIRQFAAISPAALLSAGIPLAFNLAYADATRRGLTTDSHVTTANTNVTINGVKDEQVLSKVGGTVERAVSNAKGGSTPPQSDR